MAGSSARRRLSRRGTGDVGERGGERGRSILSFPRLLIREHGRREGSRADRPACPWWVCVPKGKAFHRTIVDAGDDKAQLLDRLNRRTGKGRHRRILSVPIGPDFAQTGENRGGRRLSGSRRDKGAKLRRIELVDRTANRRPGRRVRRELVFDVLFDLAPVGDVFLMLIQCRGERMPSGSVGDKIEVLAPCRIGDCFQRRLARVANRSRRQALDDIGVIGRRLIEIGSRYAAAERALALRQAVDDRRVGTRAACAFQVD